MSELQQLREQVINHAKYSTSVEELRSMLRHVQKNRIKRRPAPEIPIMELKSGITLEEIEAQQTVTRPNFEEHMKAVGQEKWETSIVETLKSLD